MEVVKFVKMKWRNQVLHRMLTPTPTGIPGPSDEISHLVWLEKNIALHRFLRGVMIYLFLFSMTLSFFEFEAFLGNIIVHSLMMVLSVGGMACVYAIYRAEAVFSGIPNPTYPMPQGLRSLQRQHFSVIHSPNVFWMVVELLVWLVHPPPGIPVGKWENRLNAFLFCRVYVLLLYPSERWSLRLYPRAVETVLGSPQNFVSMFRRSMQAEKWLSIPIVLIIFLSLSGLYRRAEGTSLLNACYFCASTSAFVGFGNIIPVTVTGRVVAFFSWCLGLFLLAWIIRMWCDFLQLSKPTQNLYSVVRINNSTSGIRTEAAKTIQRGWRLYTVKKRKLALIVIHCHAVLLSRQCLSFRKRRLSVKRHVFHYQQELRKHDILQAEVVPSMDTKDNVVNVLQRLSHVEANLDLLIGQIRMAVGEG